jgi:hypothetical protein
MKSRHVTTSAKEGTQREVDLALLSLRRQDQVLPGVGGGVVVVAGVFVVAAVAGARRRCVSHQGIYMQVVVKKDPDSVSENANSELPQNDDILN